MEASKYELEMRLDQLRREGAESLPDKLERQAEGHERMAAAYRAALAMFQSDPEKYEQIKAVVENGRF